MDYRDIPKEFENQFDAFVSIEMVEVKFPETLAETVY
jgi:cyclopropane fatty-acyl-phospholipid synthase-like methyltransferase